MLITGRDPVSLFVFQFYSTYTIMDSTVYRLQRLLGYHVHPNRIMVATEVRLSSFRIDVHVVVVVVFFFFFFFGVNWAFSIKMFNGDGWGEEGRKGRGSLSVTENINITWRLTEPQVFH